MKTDTHKNAETLKQIFNADKLDTSVLDHVLDTDTLLGIAKDGNDLVNENNGIRVHTDVPSYPDPNGKTINSYVCEITIAPTLNENGLGMSWFENSLEDINKDLLNLGLQKIENIGEIHTVHKHGIDIKIIVKYIAGKYDKRYESYSIPEIKSKFEEKLEEAIKKSSVKTNSYRRNNMKKTIKSGRFIKSGTSNFGSNDDIFGYSFPLVTYIAENYYYDEETDSETEERDYEADDWEYRDAIDEAKDLADEMGIPQYDDYSEPYLCYEPFMIKFRDGYYEGLWIEVKEGTDETPYDEDGEYRGNSEWEPFTEEQMNKYADKLNEYFNKLCSDYGWQKLGVTARFSNGETWYSKIDNSRKSVTSGLTFRQAVQDFKAAGQWNDYYEMQQDWEAYKDGLEREGVISEKTRSTWGNPCTPEGFKKWNK